MKVLRAKSYGFCMGVRRAVDMAYAEAGSATTAKVATMGPLIHNPQALAALREQGVDELADVGPAADLADTTVVIRAHGVAPAVQRRLEDSGARIVDATCPRVRLSQKKARLLSGAGYRLFLAGESHHGEIVGIQGYAPDCLVVAGAEEAREQALALRRQDEGLKTALIGQTTLSQEEFAAIAAALRSVFPDLEVYDTICRATKDRQNALRALCAKVDALVIVGGKNSANTRRLHELALQSGKPAWHVETEAELPAGIGAYAVVGLSAGASTPDAVIDRVEARLLSLPN